MKRNQRLKVGFVFDDSLDSSDGVAQQVKTFGKWLSEQGHEVRYLVGQSKLESWAGGKVYSLSHNMKVSFNANKLSVPLPAKRSVIEQILAREKFDVLHVQMPHSPFMAQKVVNAASSNVAVIGTFHVLPAGRLSAWGSKGLKQLYRKGLRRFDQIISVSSPAAAFAKKSFGIDAIVLPNVVDEELFSAKRSASRPNSIVFLGRLVKRKGCAELIKAFAIVQETLYAANLIIAGDGPQRDSLRKLVSHLKLKDSVRFTGFINERDKAGLLASAQVACFPALYGESFGIVLLEAMAAGAGVVLGGNNPGYKSVLGEQPLLLVDPKDSQEFARRLILLLSQKATIEGLHTWQLEHVKQYDVGNVGPKLVELYREAIAKRTKKGHN